MADLQIGRAVKFTSPHKGAVVTLDVGTAGILKAIHLIGSGVHKPNTASVQVGYNIYHNVPLGSIEYYHKNKFIRGDAGQRGEE